MPFGKGEPYETDVRLPMYVRGPNVPTGVSFPHPTNHLDITVYLLKKIKRLYEIFIDCENNWSC